MNPPITDADFAEHLPVFRMIFASLASPGITPPTDAEWFAKWREWISNGWIERRNGKLVFTAEGRKHMHDILFAFENKKNWEGW